MQTDMFNTFDKSGRVKSQPRPDGHTLTPDDMPRLSAQLAATKQAMQCGAWLTLDQLAARVALITGKSVTTQSVSARLRDLRKAKFGGHTVERCRLSYGLFSYRLKVTE